MKFSWGFFSEHIWTMRIPKPLQLFLLQFFPTQHTRYLEYRIRRHNHYECKYAISLNSMRPRTLNRRFEIASDLNQFYSLTKTDQLKLSANFKESNQPCLMAFKERNTFKLDIPAYILCFCGTIFRKNYFPMCTPSTFNDA